MDRYIGKHFHHITDDEMKQFEKKTDKDSTTAFLIVIGIYVLWEIVLNII